MTKRVKPVLAVPTIKNLEEADATLAKIAELNRHINLTQNVLNEDIDRLKLQAAEEARPYEQEKEELEQALTRFVEYHRQELFTSRRSRVLNFGVIGIRKSTKLVVAGKGGFKRVLEVLQELDLGQYIRNKPEVDKEALSGAAPETHKQIGVKLQEKDVFYYELVQHELEAGDNAA